MKRMHLLVIPDNYPTFAFPQKGIFMREQVLALRTRLNKVAVLGGVPKTFSEALKSSDFRFGRLHEEPWLLNVPSIRGLLRLNNFFSLIAGKYLFKQYLIQNGRPDIVHVHNASAGTLAVWIKNK